MSGPTNSEPKKVEDVVTAIQWLKNRIHETGKKIPCGKEDLAHNIGCVGRLITGNSVKTDNIKETNLSLPNVDGSGETKLSGKNDKGLLALKHTIEKLPKDIKVKVDNSNPTAPSLVLYRESIVVPTQSTLLLPSSNDPKEKYSEIYKNISDTLKKEDLTLPKPAEAKVYNDVKVGADGAKFKVSAATHDEVKDLAGQFSNAAVDYFKNENDYAYKVSKTGDKAVYSFVAGAWEKDKSKQQVVATFEIPLDQTKDTSELKKMVDSLKKGGTTLVALDAAQEKIKESKRSSQASYQQPATTTDAGATLALVDTSLKLGDTLLKASTELNSILNSELGKLPNGVTTSIKEYNSVSYLVVSFNHKRPEHGGVKDEPVKLREIPLTIKDGVIKNNPKRLINDLDIKNVAKDMVAKEAFYTKGDEKRASEVRAKSATDAAIDSRKLQRVTEASKAFEKAKKTFNEKSGFKVEQGADGTLLFFTKDGKSIKLEAPLVAPSVGINTNPENFNNITSRLSSKDFSKTLAALVTPTQTQNLTSASTDTVSTEASGAYAAPLADPKKVSAERKKQDLEARKLQQVRHASEELTKAKTKFNEKSGFKVTQNSDGTLEFSTAAGKPVKLDNVFKVPAIETSSSPEDFNKLSKSLSSKELVQSLKSVISATEVEEKTLANQVRAEEARKAQEAIEAKRAREIVLGDVTLGTFPEHERAVKFLKPLESKLSRSNSDIIYDGSDIAPVKALDLVSSDIATRKTASEALAKWAAALK